MSRNSKHVLITGPPGVGKTTLIKKVYNALKDNNVSVNGFYTEELRDNSNKRNGFDIVSLDGKRERLSRTMECLKPNDLKRFRVGQYYVFPRSFELIALPLFAEPKNGVLVLDEIGKMELFSSKFQIEVKEAFKRTDISILATVPVLRGASIPLVESLITNPNYNLITVDRTNRNNLVNEIVTYLTS
ncbi:hypothetical protein ILUMI_03318 [Ignelater luminosus]|uniref:AAA+ ATPase domain-containing protein n=1 Tax=Ignelater luminosus TaxID=2038154 RepID=A0A8K0DM12_IGNLU|nr:hypothetical protein ILUMI_03318 [Ignelater luminosus]